MDESRSAPTPYNRMGEDDARRYEYFGSCPG